MPKETKLLFKNDEYYAPSKPVKSSINKQNVNLFEKDVKTETKVIPNNLKPHSTNSSTSQEFKENVNTKTVNSNKDQNKNFNSFLESFALGSVHLRALFERENKKEIKWFDEFFLKITHSFGELSF